MEKSIFIVLAKNNKKSHMEMCNIISKLSKVEWIKKFDGHYRSIYELCSHSFSDNYFWLNKFRALGNKDSLEKYFQKDQPNCDFVDIRDYIEMQSKMDDLIIEFIEDLTEDDLNSILKINAGEENYEFRFYLTLLHILTHSTHCRGMISLYLEMLGKENDYNGIDISA